MIGHFLTLDTARRIAKEGRRKLTKRRLQHPSPAWECGLAPTWSGWGAANGGLNEAGSLAQGYGQREGAVVRA